MAIRAYGKGDQVRLANTGFTDSAGTLADPTAVTITVRKPDGTSAPTTVTANKDSTGKYHYDATFDQSGLWEFRWTGTGAVVATEDQAAWVRQTHF